MAWKARFRGRSGEMFCLPSGAGVRIFASMLTADQVRKLLKLEPLANEGGLYAEVYRSAHRLPKEALSRCYSGDRSLSTAIYYMLTPDTFSAMHRVQSDEVFHFYLGDPVEMVQLWPDGTGGTVVLGPDLRSGMRPQVVVPHGVWQGSRLIAGGRFALLGATVAPGFDFADYEHGRRSDLIGSHPQFREKIMSLTAE